MTNCLTEYLSRTEGKDAVFVFDGFDELSEENRKESIIVDIINRRILTKCCLVVTSRPTASSNLHGSVDRRVEIVGFTEEDRLDYIQTALENSDEQVEALQHYLQSNPTINALCYIPLNMTILLCLFGDGIDKLPKTQTEMYKIFIEMTIVCFIKKHDDCDTVISIANLPHPHNKLFIELAKLAYEALKVDKIVFTLPEIKEGCPNLTMTSSNWNGLGLLKAAKCFSEEIYNDQVTFHFLHFSLQEYMAAWYISMLSKNRQFQLLQKTFWEHRYYNMWIMYVGITCGSTFALRHFLSGNHFQFYTKIFKSSQVSKKYLKHKMKCLHLFQCLVEANKEDIIDSVSHIFQNNQIDLSNQTLLPSDLNTLGFFLIRSIKNEWDELNLSNCNIGSNGTSILCDIFLDNNVRYMFTIKMVKFSYNQFNFSSLRKLFGLFNSWHTSEIIITDDAMHNNADDMKALEDIVLQSNTLVLALIGSFLFSKSIQLSNLRMLPVLSNTTSIRSVYLLYCSWKSIDFELLTLLEKQKLNKIRIISSRVDKIFIKTLALMLLSNNDFVNMFVYDTTMPDEIADDISCLILNLEKDTSGVMLIVSKSKIQGIVNTGTLSNELSALELFNLSVYIRYLNTKMCPWKEKFEANGCNKDIIYSFIYLLKKIDVNWKLKIILCESNTVIIHKVIFNSFMQPIMFTNMSVVYLSNCDVCKPECDFINKTCLTLYILSSPDYVNLLYSKLWEKHFVPRELFIYGNMEYHVLNNWIELLSPYNISAVLAANNVVVGIHPSSEHIALAMQLQPSPTTWILSATDNTSVFYQVTDALAILHTEWTKLDFSSCNIGDIEFETFYKALKCNNNSTVRKLCISFNKLSVSGICNLIRVIIKCRVQELDISGINDILLDCLIKSFICVHQKLFLSITCSEKIISVICNTSWNEVAIKMNRQASELYIINCDLQLSPTKIIDELHILMRLCIINGSVSEAIMINIVEFFLNKTIEVSISNIKIIDNDRTMKNLLTSKRFYLDAKFNFVLSAKHWLCVYNITRYQMKFIHQYFMIQDCRDTTVATKLKQISGDKLYMFENNLLKVIRVCAKVSHATDVTQIIGNTASVNTTEIDNYSIAADNLANILQHKTQLEDICLKGNCLQTNNAITIVKALQNTLALQVLSICDINITDAASDDIATIISHNMYLQELNLGNNYLQASGAIKVARSLQKVSSLAKLYIDHNSITHEATDDIAAAISYNTKLEEFDVSGNNIQTVGVVKITKALKGIYTIRRLCFNNNNITGETADDIAAAVFCKKWLQELYICDNHLQAPGAIKIVKALQSICTLTKLYLSNNKITDEAADEIATAISCNSKLQDIDLSENYLQATGAIQIMKALKGIYMLKKLNLNKNNISVEAADSIATAIICASQLNELDVGNNKLQTEGIQRIVKSLQGSQTLTKLCISNNNVTDEAANDISTGISCNVGLQEFDISRNNLNTSGAIVIARSLQKITSLIKLYINHNSITHEATDDIAAAISCNTKLEEFDVSGNNIQAMGAVKIMKALQNICTLRILCFSNNNITDEVADHIVAAISCNTKLQEIDVSGNNIQTAGAEKVMEALKGICSLRRLCISNSDEATSEILAAVCCNSKLQDIGSSENHLQTTGMIRIMKALKGIHMLKNLYLNNKNISVKAADVIAIAISYASQLNELDVGNNYLETEGIRKIVKSLQGSQTLRKLCISNNYVTGEAANDIAAAISCNVGLQEFDISGNNLNASGAIIIAKGLQKVSTLTKLLINYNNITYEAADDIAAAISCNVGLQEVDISRNNLNASGAIIIAKGLQKVSTLTKLLINHNNITYEAADDIAAAISCNVGLQEVDISGNNLNASGAIVIAKGLQKVSTLTKLLINHNNITYEAADDIAAAISCNVGLQEVDISGNNLNASGAIIISKGLQKVSTLTKLLINHNNITYEAADDIAAAISCNVGLQEVDISGNNLNASGAIIISKGLQKVSTLTKLLINHNNITYEAADDIAAAISCNVGLQEVDISRNNLNASGAIIIAKGLQKITSLTKLYINYNSISYKATDDVAAAISCNTKLQEFDVSGNNIQTAGAKKVMEALKGVCTLRRLCCSNNNVTGEAADDIAAAVSCNSKLQYIDLSENDLQTNGAVQIIKTLKDNHMLKKLYLNNNKISVKAADDIAIAISYASQLNELDVGNNYLETEGIRKIVKSLQGSQTLRKLCIRNNYVTGEAANDIAAAISCNVGLQEFDISKNNLYASGAIMIAKGLQKITSLTKLMISHSYITFEAVDDIAAVISCNIELQELNLGNNILQALSTIKIAESLQKLSTLTKLDMPNNLITDEAADSIAAAIYSNVFLQKFNMSGNLLTESGAIRIAKALQKISTLIKLYIDHNRIEDEAALDIGLAIQCNIALKEVEISGNRFSREKVLLISCYAHDIKVRNQIKR